jgi:catechol 2,3-dioxygenase-like lactoylglutathione lyase family enzyme
MDDEIRLSRIRQVAIPVSDAPSALAFCRDVLGLGFLFSPGEHPAFLAADDVRIALTAKMPDPELWTAFVLEPDGNLAGLMEERPSTPVTPRD